MLRRCVFVCVACLHYDAMYVVCVCVCANVLCGEICVLAIVRVCFLFYHCIAVCSCGVVVLLLFFVLCAYD